MAKKNKVSRSARKELVTADLNENQKIFVWFYVNDKDCFGSATKAYKKAYKCATDVANTSGPRLLRNVQIQAYKNKMLDDYLSNEHIDRELAYVATQNKDTQSKVAAIRELNKVKGRATEKVDITSQGQSIVGINYVKPNGTNNRTINKTG